ncbi:MAG: DUF5694 domain-containing protein [Bacteroidota bacterium]
MKIIITLCFFLFLTGSGQTSLAQQGAPDINTLSAPFKNQKKSKVMIVGTFHFNDGGHDAYKPKFSVNIKSARRQAEIKDLLQLFAKFKPTKVTIENMPRWQRFHDSLYTEFLNNRYEPGENEIYQVCYRMAAMMGHKKVYTIDAPAREFEDPLNIDSFAAVHHQQQYLDSTYLKLFFSLYAKDDSLKSVLPLRTTLAYENNPERLRLGLGHYLIGDFKVAADGLYPGADNSIYWWNRNLRIFSNILRLAAESKEERIFVMIGAGHLQILRFLAMACPEIEFVDAYDYLK